MNLEKQVHNRHPILPVLLAKVLPILGNYSPSKILGTWTDLLP